MNPTKFPEFELDVASREIWTPASFRGRAKHYFCFAPQGTSEEIGIWARLVERRVWKGPNRGFQYRVALWPQGAETGRVCFVGSAAKHFSPHSEDERDFNWHDWQSDFEDANYFGNLGRYWTVCQDGKTAIFRVDASDAAFYGAKDSSSEHRFFWREDDDTPRRVKDLRFLQMPNAEFERQMRALWNDKSSRLRFEADWRQLSPERQDELAFELENGDWEDFISLLRLVLITRIGREAGMQGRVSWQVFCYAAAAVNSDGNALDWDNDAFLLGWRTALFDFFCPVYPRDPGFDETIYDCVKSHFFQGNPRTRVAVSTSQHEILEANLKLRAWGGANLSVERAGQLLAL